MQLEHKGALVELVKRREAQKRRSIRQPLSSSASEELTVLDEQLLKVLEQWKLRQKSPFEFRGVDYLKMMKLEATQQHLKTMKMEATQQQLKLESSDHHAPTRLPVESTQTVIHSA